MSRTTEHIVNRQEAPSPLLPDEAPPEHWAQWTQESIDCMADETAPEWWLEMEES